RERIVRFCKQHHIRTSSFFGSILRDEFTPLSDIDMLVEFEPVHVPGFLTLVRMEEELSSIFNDRKIDLRTPQDLSRYFRDEVLATREVLYSAA
ncbi:MAG: nucleotidyltransferase domain-containing protein, partial [Thermoplasmata archaeon]|nr:nucleotidyltransferase domain-containing protein [Thermoplasmata archaeon]